MKLTKAQSDHVEHAGRWWESNSAGSRTAGRMLGWLMICEPAYQSSSDLVEALQSSPGSVSTQSRTLETLGLVERVTFPGDRQTYYQLPPKVWPEILWSEQQRLEGLRGLAAKARDITPAERPDRVTDLERIAEFLVAEWPDLMERLNAYLEKETTS